MNEVLVGYLHLFVDTLFYLQGKLVKVYNVNKNIIEVIEMNDKMRIAAMCWLIDRIEYLCRFESKDDSESITPLVISAGMEMKDTFYQGYHDYWSDDYNSVVDKFNKYMARPALSFKLVIEECRSDIMKAYDKDDYTYEPYEEPEVRVETLPPTYENLSEEDKYKVMQEYEDAHEKEFQELMHNPELNGLTPKEIVEKYDEEVWERKIIAEETASILRTPMLDMGFIYLMNKDNPKDYRKSIYNYAINNGVTKE